MCSSELGRNRPGIEQAIGAIMRALLGRTAEQGARQLVWAALGPDGKEGPHVKQTMHGAYVSIAEVREPSDFVISKEGWEAQEKVWVSHGSSFMFGVCACTNEVRLAERDDRYSV